MATVTLSAQARSDRGKGVARKLRAQERIPAVLYGATVAEPVHLSLDSKELRNALSTSAGFRVVMNLSIEGADDSVAILKEIQRDPVSHRYLHADLFAIDLNQPIEIEIPIHPEGTPPGVKLEGGVLGWARREVLVRVLPTKIPEAITLDLSDLHLNQSIHIGDLSVEDAEILDEPELTVCSVSSVVLITETEDAETDEEAVEGEEGDEASAEGEDGASDDEKPEGE